MHFASIVIRSLRSAGTRWKMRTGWRRVSLPRTKPSWNSTMTCRRPRVPAVERAWRRPTVKPRKTSTGTFACWSVTAIWRNRRWMMCRILWRKSAKPSAPTPAWRILSDLPSLWYENVYVWEAFITIAIEAPDCDKNMKNAFSYFL